MNVKHVDRYKRLNNDDAKNPKKDSTILTSFFARDTRSSYRAQPFLAYYLLFHRVYCTTIGGICTQNSANYL